MNWRYKALLQTSIARMPMSDHIYYLVQRSIGQLKKGQFDPQEWIVAAAEMLEWLQRGGHSIAGKRFLEVGTGQALGIPLILWLCGAEQTVTVDVNRYLSATLVKESNEYFVRNADKIHQIYKAYDDGGFRSRLSKLSAFSGDLATFLDLIHVDYHSPADATQLRFPEHSFDFHYSYSVFEHVPPLIIAAILKEARRVLRPRGVLFHTIDLSDHFFYGDDSITRINFLRFSDKQWHRWAGNKYMYHNRLRVAEHLKLFETAGVSLERESRAVDERSLEALKNGFPLYSGFQSARPEELAVTALQVMGHFPDLRSDDVVQAHSNSHAIEWKHLK